jgi:hypothetical protein
LARTAGLLLLYGVLFALGLSGRVWAARWLAP